MLGMEYDCIENKDGWGPSVIPVEISKVPFTIYNKSDKNWRMMDFSYQSRGTKLIDESKEGFSMVDAVTVPKQRRTILKKKTYRPYQPPIQSQMQPRPQRKNVYIKYEPSITMRPDWKLLGSFLFTDLSKYNSQLPQVEDISFNGTVKRYKDSIESIHPKKPVTINKSTKKYNLPVSKDDPIIQELAGEDKATIFATDDVISMIGCCTRSIYPWDLLVSKLSDRYYFLYSRKDLDLHRSTSWETTQPNDKPNLTTPAQLEEVNNEVTELADAFKEYVLSDEKVNIKGMEEVDFDMEEEEIPDMGFKYRLFKFPDGRNMIVRTHVDGVCKRNDKDEYFLTCLLNEWNDLTLINNRYQEKIQKTLGALLHKELKMNSFRTAKIACQAILSGAENIKIGYATRKQISDPKAGHYILGVQNITTAVLSEQMTLNMTNVWGIVNYILGEIEKYDNGRYMIYRDCSKPMIEIYHIPEGTLAEDGDIDEGEEEDNEN